MSGDPTLSDYIPKAPIDGEAKKHNEKLPGMGGVYNTVNLHLYHYAGNNPVKYTDPDGKNIFDDIGSAVKNAWEKTVGVANTAKDTVVNTISAGWNAITYFHFEGRDEKNIISESFNDIEKSSRQTDGNWIELPEEMAMYHQNGIGSPERKFICKEGREAVFSKDDSPNGNYQLVTDPRYKGTYNYCNPASLPTLPNGITDFKGIGNCISASLQFAVKGAGHFFADMLPYYVMGCKNERNQ